MPWMLRSRTTRASGAAARDSRPAMATDDGFFGPSSVSWRIHRDASAILGAGRALLMQALEPHVMAVFLQNTHYPHHPWGRLPPPGKNFRADLYRDHPPAGAAREKGRL